MKGPALRNGAALLAGVVLAAPAAAAQRFTLDQALARALEASPRILSARAGLGTERSAAAAARGLQNNPELTVLGGPRVGPDVVTPDWGAEMSQRVQLFGRSAAVARADAMLAAAEARLAAASLDVARDVRAAFARSLAAARLVEVEAEALRIAEEALRGARERLAAQAALRLEVNGAVAEAAVARRGLALARRAQAEALADLALLLALPPGETVAVQGELTPGVLEIGDAAQEALRARPELTAARRELEAARAAQQVADAAVLPVPEIGVGFVREEDLVIPRALVTVELPVFNRNGAARGEAAAGVEQARLAVADLERQVAHEARTALADWRSLRDALDEFARTALPALQENLALAEEAHRAGKFPFHELVEARRDWLAGRRTQLELLEELADAEAKLLRALGRAG